MTIVNYPVGDFLIRVKNAAMAKNREVEVKSTKLIKEVAKVLKNLGYLEKVEEGNGQIKVRLAFRQREPVLINLRLVSKPGLRVYMGADELESIKKPTFFIISTSQGVLSNKEALKKRVGGEVIAEVL